MAKTPAKSSRTPGPSPVSIDENVPAAPVSPVAPVASEPEIVRLTLPLDPAGKLRLDRMRPSTVDALRKMLDEPTLRAVRGEAGASTDAADPAVNAVIVNVIYDAIGSLAVLLARSKGYTEEHANLLRYTAEEKSAMGPLTVKVLEKHNLLGGKYADEIALVTTIGAITVGHVMALQQAAATATVKAGAA